MLARCCHLWFKTMKDNTAETSSNKRSPQLLLDHRAKKRVQISNQQVFISNGKRPSVVQILATPAATLNKLCSHQVPNFHPGWMLIFTNASLDPTRREGNGSLWVNSSHTCGNTTQVLPRVLLHIHLLNLPGAEKFLSTCNGVYSLVFSIKKNAYTPMIIVLFLTICCNTSQAEHKSKEHVLGMVWVFFSFWPTDLFSNTKQEANDRPLNTKFLVPETKLSMSSETKTQTLTATM